MAAAAFKRLFRLLGSYGLSCVLLALLLVLTYLGTLHQVEHGLYAAKQKYFASFLLIHRLFGAFPVPLPGGYLLLSVFFVNLLCGGILRARKGWSHVGILTAHAGVLFLLLGGFITHEFSENGHVTLFEGEHSDYFESYYEWELAIAPVGGDESGQEFVIPQKDFERLGPGQARAFFAEKLPFRVTLSGFTVNAVPRPAGALGSAQGVRVVDGFFLDAVPPEKERERNVPGVYAAVEGASDSTPHEGIVWAGERGPFCVEANGAAWTFTLRKRRMPLPFTLTLDRFTRELHPRTNLPKAFASDVTTTQNGTTQKVRIEMNDPLRYRGYTIFQSGWGPPDAGPNARLYSTLAVVKNPADPFPLYACVIVTLGLVLHLARKLGMFLASRRRAAA